MSACCRFCCALTCLCICVSQEGRKKFEKQTQKFCTSLERHLNMSTKKHEDQAMKEVSADVCRHLRLLLMCDECD